MVLGTSPEGKEVVQTPGELVTAVRIDGLEQAQHNPEVHGQNMQITSNSTPKDGGSDCAETQNHNFNGRSVFGSEAKRSRILVMDLVDVLVEEAEVHRAMSPIVPSILEHEEDRNLESHLVDARERHRGAEAKKLAHGVEEPDLRELDCEVREED